MIYWICQIRGLYPEQTRTAPFFSRLSKKIQFSPFYFLLRINNIHCDYKYIINLFLKCFPIRPGQDNPCLCLVEVWVLDILIFLAQTSNSCVTVSAKVITGWWGMVWNMKSPVIVSREGRLLLDVCPLLRSSDLSFLPRKPGPVFALNGLNWGQCHRTSLTWLWCTLTFLAHF